MFAPAVLRDDFGGHRQEVVMSHCLFVVSSERLEEGCFLLLDAIFALRTRHLDAVPPKKKHETSVFTSQYWGSISITTIVNIKCRLKFDECVAYMTANWAI